MKWETQTQGKQETKTRWLNINLRAIAHNVREVNRLLQPSVKLLAVVKADGYGHGAVEVASTALLQGAAMLGVTHPEEGIILRQAGITAPILVFRPLLAKEVEAVFDYGLTPSVSSLDQAQCLAGAARQRSCRVPVHWKIETGMGRTGFVPSEFQACFDQLLNLEELEGEGIYTHFAAAAGDRQYTRSQFQKFTGLLDDLERKGLTFKLRHVANSAALLLYPEMQLDLVRVGTLLYGQLPAGIKNSSLKLEETWSFWGRVVYLMKVARGDTVGYGRTWRARKDTTLALIPTGYSDGFGVDVFPRPSGLWDLGKTLAKIIGSFAGLPWGSSYVRVQGKWAQVVGRAGMELSCVDVSNIPGVEVGTPVWLPARRTVVSSRVPRIYEREELQEEIR